jgi:hypothetical protein
VATLPLADVGTGLGVLVAGLVGRAVLHRR